MKSPILDLRFSNPPRRSRNPPNVEKEMLIDDEVRVAAYSLQSIPIIWYRKCKSKAKYKAGGGDATSINDSKSTEMHQYNNDDKNNNESEGNYIGIESSLSVIDNKVSGPAVLVSTSLSAQLCQGYDIIDIDSNFDEVRNCDDEKDEPKDFFEPYIERTIPLNNIDYALPGGNWEWENILQVGSGSCSCHVKVYSVAPQRPPPLLGSGKKVLLFDVNTSREINRDEIVNHLNLLVEWNRKRNSG